MELKHKCTLDCITYPSLCWVYMLIDGGNIDVGGIHICGIDRGDEI